MLRAYDGLGDVQAIPEEQGRASTTPQRHWQRPMGSVERPEPCCRIQAASSLRRSWPSMRRDAARKLWLKLQEQGWRQVQPQWGEGADI